MSIGEAVGTQREAIDGSGALGRASALEVLDMFARRELAPSEYLEALLYRVAADTSSSRPINAFTEVLEEDARRAAAQADDAYARNRVGPDRRLVGLPVATKEKHALSGRSHSQGMRVRAGAIAEEDHPIVGRIRRHGGIIHGRTTSPEFSCATFTHTEMWGVTRNPWDRSLSPGGSSGGSAAAVSAGMTPLATSSDIAGSTRVPAAFTGIVGYKGPYGAVPGATALSADWYRGDGAMGRSVADVALLIDVIRGVHPEDHATVPTASVGVPDGQIEAEALAGRRIAYSPTLGDHPVQRSVRRQVDAAVSALEAAGADVVPVNLPWTTSAIRETTMAHFGHLLAPGMERAFGGDLDAAEDYTRQFIREAKERALRISFVETLEREHRMQAELAAAMTGADALVAPVSAVASLPAGQVFPQGLEVSDVVDGSDRHVEHYWEAHMTVPFNVANRCPALSVPAGVSDGLPIGLQIVGHPYDESTVFSVGAALETIRPFAATPQS